MSYQNPDAVAAGAPEWRLPAPQPRHAPDGIQGFVWALWPWMNWVLPAFMVLHGFVLGTGGWESLMLLVGSPVIVPAAGLLGALPRFVLRKRGHATTPGPIVWLLFVNWWGWVTLTITMPGVGDSGAVPSVLRGLVTAPLSLMYEQIMFAVAVLVALLAWIAILVLACVVRVPVPPRRTWTLASWVALFAMPVVLIAAVWAGVIFTTQQRDAAGDTVAEVEAMPIAAQAARAEASYEVTQQKLSQVREVIAEDGWSARDEDGAWVVGSGFGSSYGACTGADAECYTFEVGFEFAQKPAGFDGRDAGFAEELEVLGWKASNRAGEWTDADGFTVDIVPWPDGRLEVSIESPAWWGKTHDIGEQLGEADADRGLARTYRYDEWPPLR